MKNGACFTEICRLCGFSDDDTARFRACLNGLDTDALCDAFFTEAAKAVFPFANGKLGTFSAGFCPYDAVYAPLYAYAKKTGTPPESLFLAFLLYAAVQTRKEYQKRGIPDDFFRLFLSRTAESAEAYRCVHGVPGLTEYLFFMGYASLDLVAVGSLTVRLSPYLYKPFCALDASCFVLQVHISPHADLSAPALAQAYQNASLLGGTDVFVADSYLLYPPIVKKLPDTSRIRAFASSYTLISVEESFEYRELTHVFGDKAGLPCDSLPKNTLLQRLYAERIRDGLPVGTAVGVFCYHP